jgi:hypothetical protein
LFIKALRDAELKYDILEKQDYALVKAFKSFRVYVLQSNITTYVPSNSVKEILVHPENEGKRGKWIVKLLEYDLHINPTKLMKGHGLAKLLSDSNYKALELHHIFNQSDAPLIQARKNTMYVLDKYSLSPWYRDIIYFLQHLECPPELEKSKTRSLKLKVVKYCNLNQNLYWKDTVGILLKCLDEDESKHDVNDMHKGFCGGHQHWKATTLKVLRVGYYCPTIFSDVFSMVRTCEECQKFDGKKKLLSLPLKPIIANNPFQQWGLDFIGEINPPSSGQHKWILTDTYYFTKWIEVVPTRNSTDKMLWGKSPYSWSSD